LTTIEASSETDYPTNNPPGHTQKLGHPRPDRRDRREQGKSDPIDAENAARAVLAGTATGVPKTADGTSEVIREIKIARDTAVKSRTQAVITLKTLIVTAPDELR
jgi:transposase